MQVPHTVLVTGALGQVGSRVTALLLERGHTLVALDLRTAATEAVAARLEATSGNGRLVLAYTDLRDPDAVHHVVAEHQPQAIVHLAAVIPPLAYRAPELARQVNVDGTANLVAAAERLAVRPLFVEASSAAVYGSRNPASSTGPVTASTPLAPVDCYGQQKVDAEEVVAASTLPHVTLRLGGIVSPDSLRPPTRDLARLVRAIPADNRVHVADARDVALAFANAADPDHSDPADLDGRILLIAGDESCAHLQHELEDDLTAAIGIGRVGTVGTLPGNPEDEKGWGLTDWFDTAEAQRLLAFQEHTWDQTTAWLAGSMGRGRHALRLLGPVLRVLLRWGRAALNRIERRGRYADPWAFIAGHYGPGALAATQDPTLDPTLAAVPVRRAS